MSLGLPHRLRELGRLRLGDQKTDPRRPGKPRATWRITSASPELLANCAEIYGGEVAAWPEAKGQGQQFQLSTEAESLDVLIPLGMALSQYYEQWSADGCTVRCDGRTNLITDDACSCPADIAARMELAAKKVPEACKPTTRLSVLLPRVPDLGVWLMVAHGYQAAIEIPGTLQILAGMLRSVGGADATDALIPAAIRIDQRSVKKPGQPPNHFVVPVIETRSLTPAMLMAGQSSATVLDTATVAEIGPGAPASPALEPGSQRPVAVVGAAPAAPPDDDDDPGRPFTEADEKLVDKPTQRAWQREMTEAGWDEQVQAAAIHRATRGRTSSIRSIERSEWDRLTAVVDALIAGKLAEAVIDGSVRLVKPEAVTGGAAAS